jgi:hypothetical protein
VNASPDGLNIERRAAWRTYTKQIAASEIIDLDYSTVEGVIAAASQSAQGPTVSGTGMERLMEALKRWVPNKGIVVKSRTELITLGEGLPTDELQYLHQVLRHALTGP